MVTLSKDLCQHCCIQCPWPCVRPLSTHASTISWCHMNAVLLCLTSFSMTINRSIHVAANGIISLSLMPAEAPILWPLDVKKWLIGKYPDAGKYWRQEEKGTTEDEMVGWHHWVNEYELEQAPGVGDWQESLASMGLQIVGHDWATELNWKWNSLEKS